MLNEMSETIAMISLAIKASVGNVPGKEPEAAFFISKDGRDSWSGRLAAPNAEKTDGPFATIVRARDATACNSDGARR